MTGHVPRCPSWTCVGCGEEWPCQLRRLELLAEYANAWVSLNIYMAGQFVQACADLPDEPAGVLHGRFFGWMSVAGGRHRVAGVGGPRLAG